MKTPAAFSPFAAKTSQEQKEQWIWWQCQQDAAIPVDLTDKTDARSVPELKLPKAEETERKEEKPTAAQLPTRQPTRHGQYDAVLRRMRDATRQASTYTSVNREG